MPSPAQVLARSQPYAKTFIWAVLVAAIVYMCAGWFEWLAWLRLPLALASPVIYAWLLLLVIGFGREGTGSIPQGLFGAAVAFVGGGAALDFAAILTGMLSDPTLEHETNSFALALIDAGLLPLVHLGELLFAVLPPLLILLLLAAFLKHRETLLALAREAQPKTAGQFIVAAMGSKDLIWWQAIVNLKPDAYANYCNFMLLAFYMSPASIYRWYTGLRWLDVMPNAAEAAAVIALILPLVVYFMWLWFEWKRETHH